MGETTQPWWVALEPACWFRGNYRCVTPPVIPLQAEDWPGEYREFTADIHAPDRHRQTLINVPDHDFGRRRRRFKHD